MMFGSLLTDKIIVFGRLNSAYIANALILISIIPMMWLTVFSLILGRFMLGFGAGMFIVITSVY